MPTPRVLVLFSTLAVGGAERQVSVLAPGLRDHGFDLLVATLRERGRFFEELRNAGVATQSIGMRSRTDIRGILRALALKSHRPDIVVTQSLDGAQPPPWAHVNTESKAPWLAIADALPRFLAWPSPAELRELLEAHPGAWVPRRLLEAAS